MFIHNFSTCRDKRLEKKIEWKKWCVRILEKWLNSFANDNKTQ